MKFKFLTLLLLVSSIIGCTATRNMEITSYTNKLHDHKKPNNIYIKASKYSKVSQFNIDLILEDILDKRGLKCVGKIENADKILEYRYDDSSKLYSSGYTPKHFGLSNKVFEKPIFEELGGRIVTNIEEGYCYLSLRIYDTKILYKKDRPSQTWGSSILAPIEKIINDPTIALELLLDLYGQNKEYRGKFPVSK